MSDTHQPNMPVVCGNSARRLEDVFNWTFYVRGRPELIERVVVTLHPTFPHPVRELCQPPFELECTGWGTFPVGLVIHWKGGVQSNLSWPLQFDKSDANCEVPIPDAVVRSQSKGSSSTLGSLRNMLTFFADGNADVDDRSRSRAPTPAVTQAWDEQTVSGLREAVQDRLRSTPFLPPTHACFMHGRAYDGPVDTPHKTWSSSRPPRDDHDAPEWLTASEFADRDEVFAAKCAQLATLMRLSKKTVLYTGAGISAAVVGQAARGSAAAGSGDSLRAKPTFTHIALGFLGKEGMIHDWVQQNHDGLPQKAGFPQEKINEIHGEHVYAHVYTCLHTCLYTCLYTYLYTCL